MSDDVFCCIKKIQFYFLSTFFTHKKLTLQQRFFRYKLRHSMLFQIQLRSSCKHHPVLKLVPAQEAVIIHSHFIVDFLFQDFHGFFS